MLHDFTERTEVQSKKKDEKARNIIPSGVANAVASGRCTVYHSCQGICRIPNGDMQCISRPWQQCFIRNCESC